MAKCFQIILFFAIIGAYFMHSAEAGAIVTSDTKRGLLRGRASGGPRRLGWKKFIKSVKKDADSVADDIEDAIDDIGDVADAGYCDVVKIAAKNLLSDPVTTDAGCALLGTEAALECESAGGGPEDPIADMCAVAISAAGVAACESAIADGGSFDADALESDLGC
ncbi:Hypothetical Protein FCC1311_083582 [Hondaea fermentalgiana]|uniref:Uncharacterized protein n=1 Tax=Hondaea fermentalgiana TaxID=2315210 RepID=A0A2R5GU10_9STRA|nr:Hypothetical Protein FCC1311_083582 [Hondaea fermentalgiana]|eukprot:GBG32133.1 Hypothetical Protein FCC1311_083582 [Hondaea fermentalgiana]